jgi:hypothetical protein
MSIEIDQRIDAIVKKMAMYANEENGLIFAIWKTPCGQTPVIYGDKIILTCKAWRVDRQS